MKGDAGRLQQVLLNLVSNTIKYTEVGEVRLRVTLLEDAQDHVVVRWEVRDTGVGIDDASQPHIFQAFYQARPDAGTKYPGTGLGLPITQQLVAMMEGEMGVISEPGIGSTF